MKKIIKITESQLFNLANKKKNLMELEMSPIYREHWERKFEKSAEILLKLGQSPSDLTKKIELIASENGIIGNSEINENYKIGGHEFSIMKIGDETIYVGKDGILGEHKTFIPWEIVSRLLQKYNDMPSYRKL
jgi:hypothetical protein